MDFFLLGVDSHSRFKVEKWCTKWEHGKLVRKGEFEDIGMNLWYRLRGQMESTEIMIDLFLICLSVTINACGLNVPVKVIKIFRQNSKPVCMTLL